MRWADLVALTVIDIVARLGVPGSLMALAHGDGDLALVAAAVVSVLALVRGVLSGHAIERSLRQVWREILDAVGLKSIVTLRARPEQQAVGVLVDAARITSIFHAEVVPKIAANAIGLLLVCAVMVVRFSAEALVAGVLAMLLLGALATFTQLRLRRAQQRAWDSFGGVVRDFGVVLNAADELRAHGRQPAFEQQLHDRVAVMARSERQANTYGALVQLFPIGVALLVASVALRDDIGGLAARLQLQSVAEASLLVVTALALAIGLVRGSEAALRAGPSRQAIATLLARAPAPAAPALATAARAKRVPVLPEATIELDRVSIRFPGAADSTPHCLSHRWAPGAGLALGGPNGAGKTSLALAVLGLLEPAEGTIRFGDVPVEEVDWAELRSRCTYLPQQAFLAPGASVGWHLRLLLGPSAGDDELEQALRTVGLYPVLAARASGEGSRPLDVLAGALSGGERRRLHLARAFIGDRDLVVLDEPEAGLDARGRDDLRDLIAELASRRRVLLIAHDPSIIPEGFERLRCERRPYPRAGEGGDLGHEP